MRQSPGQFARPYSEVIPVADTPTPKPPTPPKRVRRWPTAVITCLLTLVASYLLERYALPTQGWWVAHNRDRHPTDMHYLEGVVYSKALSPEAKVGFSHTGAEDSGNGFLLERPADRYPAVSAIALGANARAGGFVGTKDDGGGLAMSRELIPEGGARRIGASALVI